MIDKYTHRLSTDVYEKSIVAKCDVMIHNMISAQCDPRVNRIELIISTTRIDNADSYNHMQLQQTQLLAH